MFLKMLIIHLNKYHEERTIFIMLDSKKKIPRKKASGVQKEGCELIRRADYSINTTTHKSIFSSKTGWTVTNVKAAWNVISG